jgi:hypothetical protein
MKTAKMKGPQRAKGKVFIGGYVDQDIHEKIENAVEQDRSSVSQFIRTSLIQTLNQRKPS